jgi:WD40 repeat protein
MIVHETGASKINGLAFLADGALAVATSDLGVTRVDLDGVTRMMDDNLEIHAVCATALGLAAGNAKRLMIVNSAATLSHALPTTAPVTAIVALDIATLVFGTGDRAREWPGTLTMITLGTTLKARSPVMKEPKGVIAIAAHPELRIIAWANHARKVSLWDPRRQDPQHLMLPHKALSLAFHPHLPLIALSQEWGAKVYDMNQGMPILNLDAHKGRVTGVAYSPDGRTLATSSWDGTVKLWSAEDGKLIASHDSPLGQATALAYAPDGTRLAAAGDTGRVVVWDLG